MGHFDQWYSSGLQTAGHALHLFRFALALAPATESAIAVTSRSFTHDGL